MGRAAKTRMILHPSLSKPVGPLSPINSEGGEEKGKEVVGAEEEENENMNEEEKAPERSKRRKRSRSCTSSQRKKKRKKGEERDKDKESEEDEEEEEMKGRKSSISRRRRRRKRGRRRSNIEATSSTGKLQEQYFQEERAKKCCLHFLCVCTEFAQTARLT